MKLPLKLAILVIVIFSLLVTGMVLWKPMKVKYYAAKLHDEDISVRQNAAKILLDLDRERVFRYYTDHYDPKSVEKRMAMVDELCEVGDKGKVVMKEIFRNHACTEQAKIPAGTLKLKNGSTVDIQSLYVDKYEVTFEKYRVFMVCSGHPAPKPTTMAPPRVAKERDKLLYLFTDKNYNSIGKELGLPVTRISWNDATAYAKWIGMRLPTVDEWEYVARAGSTGKFCFGDNESLLDEYAWYKNNSGGKTHPVGQKKPNNWGLYDIHGNLWEWCSNTKTGDNLRATIKGGGYSDGAKSTSFPIWTETLHTRERVQMGFRCVRDVK